MPVWQINQMRRRWQWSCYENTSNKKVPSIAPWNKWYSPVKTSQQEIHLSKHWLSGAMLVRRILRRISPRICGLKKIGDGIGFFPVRHDDFQKFSGFSFVKKKHRRKKLTFFFFPKLEKSIFVPQKRTEPRPKFIHPKTNIPPENMLLEHPLSPTEWSH